MERRPASSETTNTIPRSRAAWSPEPGWQDLLVGQCPKTLFERIVGAGDPLALRRLCARQIRASAVFVDADRVHLRALARIVAAVIADGAPRQRRFLVAQVDVAIDDVVCADRECADLQLDEQVTQAGDAPPTAHSVFARPFELTESQMLSACVAFNMRPYVERIAFFAMVVERKSMEEAGAACSVAPLKLARRARKALECALRSAEGSGVDRAALANEQPEGQR